jgi:hypothetical protein
MTSDNVVEFLCSGISLSDEVRAYSSRARAVLVQSPVDSQRTMARAGRQVDDGGARCQGGGILLEFDFTSATNHYSLAFSSSCYSTTKARAHDIDNVVRNSA